MKKEKVGGKIMDYYENKDGGEGTEILVFIRGTKTRGVFIGCGAKNMLQLSGERAEFSIFLRVWVIHSCCQTKGMPTLASMRINRIDQSWIMKALRLTILMKSLNHKL